MRPVLRQPPFGDIQFRHELDTRDDRSSQRIRRRIHIVEHAVNAVAKAQIPFEGLEVDIGSRATRRHGKSSG